MVPRFTESFSIWADLALFLCDGNGLWTVSRGVNTHIDVPLRQVAKES